MKKLKEFRAELALLAILPMILPTPQTFALYGVMTGSWLIGRSIKGYKTLELAQIVSHAGFGILIIGVAINGGFKESADRMVAVGEKFAFAGYSVTYKNY